MHATSDHDFIFTFAHTNTLYLHCMHGLYEYIHVQYCICIPLERPPSGQGHMKLGIIVFQKRWSRINEGDIKLD